MFAAVIAIPLCMTGCRDVAGFTANIFGDMREKKYQVDAKYKTLGGHSVAIVVEADQYIHFQNPGAASMLQRAVAAELRLRVPNVTLTDPSQIEKFQKENPYWTTLSYGELLKRLNVQRIIFIDIAEYSLHEPGNANVWRGTARGNVGILEDNAANTSNFTFTESIDAVFPNDSKVGVLNSDDATMQFGLTKRFAALVVGLFYDHEVVEKN